MSVFEMAKYYYPHLWNKNRIKILCEANKLSQEQYKEIVGEDYK